MTEPIIYLMRALAMLLIIPAHEAAHAFVSWKLGDPTAKNYGRLTLNPVAHFDLMGAVCMILIGVGWAKPVPTDPRRFRHPRRDMALSAAAGPVCNLLLAYLGMVLTKIWTYTASYSTFAVWVLVFLECFYSLNVSLAVFNLLPVPPFDGSRILLVFLPRRIYFGLMRYERYLMVAMLVLAFSGLLDGPLTWLNMGAHAVLDWSTGFIDRIFASTLYTTFYI
ncbi:MAG TPA: site-2 protease family protein [Candidatus Anaerofilum faecale]|nr:site-2 protease family protein [Anaerofilum sp. An201]OUP02305.1 site-2 protease family protein [Anaerofilum sp. An201]HIX13493.1 site-2 protease family protein [Candidatus Anaerofilum faecale]